LGRTLLCTYIPDDLPGTHVNGLGQIPGLSANRHDSSLLPPTFQVKMQF
jgi:hypothetical protein